MTRKQNINLQAKVSIQKVSNQRIVVKFTALFIHSWNTSHELYKNLNFIFTFVRVVPEQHCKIWSDFQRRNIAYDELICEPVQMF